MIRLKPDWIGELVSICAADDWADAQHRLDYPDVSPMFRRLLPEMAEADDVGGYSSAEVRACRAALERLSQQHPDEYAALTWEFQTWKRRHLERSDDHEALTLRAGELLAKFVDEMLGA
jgi:hypothetical protein